METEHSIKNSDPGILLANYSHQNRGKIYLKNYASNPVQNSVYGASGDETFLPMVEGKMSIMFCFSDTNRRHTMQRSVTETRFVREILEIVQD